MARAISGRNMRVLHILGCDLNSGAGRGTYSLHSALNSLGINSKIYTNSIKTINDNQVCYTVITKRAMILRMIRKRLDKFITFFYHNKEDRIFSSGIFGIDLTKTLEYKKADIIHMHWINGGFINIKHLSKINKPIIWTMRDMWPMTGGCHYSISCDKYMHKCGKCPQLKRNCDSDLSRLVINRKNQYFPEGIKLVGISEWLSNIARKSYLFNNYDVRTISNNIDTQDFFKIQKKTAQNNLGIQTYKKIILCGAINLNNSFKGFEKFIEALKELDSRKYFLCFFGKQDESVLARLGFEYKNIGYLDNNTALRMAYNSADVFVAPSLIEAFGKTIAESMACGTPVVCFDTSGPKDIISHQIDGYLAEPFKSTDLARGVVWLLNTENYEKICSNARKKIISKFDSRIIAEKYIKLYKEVL